MQTVAGKVGCVGSRASSAGIVTYAIELDAELVLLELVEDAIELDAELTLLELEEIEDVIELDAELTLLELEETEEAAELLALDAAELLLAATLDALLDELAGPPDEPPPPPPPQAAVSIATATAVSTSLLYIDIFSLQQYFLFFEAASPGQLSARNPLLQFESL